ncbi:hypothetical protein DFH07DRAFT_959685 [Mycena maculata]|uniref:Uncharacterized protein n=1 Tax=Mycena maculata TaxID=230809 RepID=A0AAD7NC92_9AGAR|nr:hypothetical protein DFH07DRAFT_959685 [Mycena maculata]
MSEIPAHMKTNLPVEEMIPERDNVAHDSRYWCLPPVREDLTVKMSGKAMYLVAQGCQCGIFRNVSVAKVMAQGHPKGVWHGHDTTEGCIEEWQRHCALGLHPHPADPLLPAPMSASPRKNRSGSVLLGKGKRVDAKLQADLQQFCMPKLDLPQPSSSASLSSLSSLSGSSTAPAAPTYFAVWNGRKVYSNQNKAKEAFIAAARAGGKETLLTTPDYDEAHAYAMGIGAAEF